MKEQSASKPSFEEQKAAMKTHPVSGPFPSLSVPNRPTRHTLIRDVAVGPNGEIRRTETMEVEIIWPADRTGWNTGGGDWRILDPPPIGFYVDHANEPSMEALKQDEISRQYQRDGTEP